MWIVSKLHKVNSVQEAYAAKCFAVHILKFEIFQTTWKMKQKKSKYWWKTECNLQDFKSLYVNCKASGASILYWQDWCFGQFRHYDLKLVLQIAQQVLAMTYCVSLTRNKQSDSLRAKSLKYKKILKKKKNLQTL